jgi:hypothetical protein
MLKIVTALANGNVLVLANGIESNSLIAGLNACISVLNDEGCPSFPATVASERY